jgi:hypothetical protein
MGRAASVVSTRASRAVVAGWDGEVGGLVRSLHFQNPESGARWESPFQVVAVQRLARNAVAANFADLPEHPVGWHGCRGF